MSKLIKVYSNRLSFCVKPLRYQLTLKPDLKKFVFDGEEIITLILLKKANRITIHAIELKIVSAFVEQKNASIKSLKIAYNKKNETVTFVFPHKLKKGKLKLKVVFMGILNDKMHGFYRSRFVVGGKEHYMATTQFEATDARRAFPCIDEPSAKAIFDIKLVVPAKSTAISNTMPISSHKTSDGNKIVEFSPSPKMSTYLVAFIVSDLEYIQKKTKEGVLVRVFTTPGKKHQAIFALDCAVKSLSFFTKYFDIPYPLPVLDMIAIPDFALGAMENWGAITYRENALLIDPENSSEISRQWVAVVISHEISHQWFGNLVTMEWWTHLWLNEGFASYIEYLAVDHMFPKWEIWTQFVSGDFGNALQLDSLKHTHPIEVPVNNPNEISEIFDAVSYSKGASVIRMLAGFVGEKDFRDSLRHYLKKHSYKNTSTSHLWESFEIVSKKPVAKFMRAWTTTSGYPLLTISRHGSILHILQSRFFISPLSKKTTKDKTLWQVPLIINGFKNNLKESILVGRKVVNCNTQFKDGWVKANFGEKSFVRIAYSGGIRKTLIEAVRNKEISPVDRLGLIRDFMNLAIAGELNTQEVLEFISAYKDETSYVVWSEISSGLSKIGLLIVNEPYYPIFEKYCIEIYSDAAVRVGWEIRKGESHLDKLLRSLILSQAGRYGDARIIKRSQNLFSRITKNKNLIHPDLRSTVYATVARHGGRREFNSLISMYKNSSLHEEKNRICVALGLFDQKDLLNKTLNFSLSKYVRPQDTSRFISVILGNPKGSLLAWKFIRKKWRYLIKRYGGAKNLSGVILSMEVFTHKHDADSIKKFFKNNPAPGADRTINQVLERIRANAQWLNSDNKKIENWLVNNVE